MKKKTKKNNKPKKKKESTQKEIDQMIDNSWAYQPPDDLGAKPSK